MLPSGRLKEALRRLEREPEAGKPLRGSLAGCRSLRVGDSRVVYRLTGEDVEVLVIGRRRESEVYELAATRL